MPPHALPPSPRTHRGYLAEEYIASSRKKSIDDVLGRGASRFAYQQGPVESPLYEDGE